MRKRGSAGGPRPVGRRFQFDQRGGRQVETRRRRRVASVFGGWGFFVVFASEFSGESLIGERPARARGPVHSSARFLWPAVAIGFPSPDRGARIRRRAWSCDWPAAWLGPWLPWRDRHARGRPRTTDAASRRSGPRPAGKKSGMSTASSNQAARMRSSTTRLEMRLFDADRLEVGLMIEPPGGIVVARADSRRRR